MQNRYEIVIGTTLRCFFNNLVMNLVHRRLNDFFCSDGTCLDKLRAGEAGAPGDDMEAFRCTMFCLLVRQEARGGPRVELRLEAVKSPKF